MHITQLHVENFRNLANQVVALSPNINLVTGDNGAGKTSLLEALYFLGRQRSFRTSKPKELLQTGKGYFRLIAKTEQPVHQIGLERRLEKNNLNFQLRIDRQPHKSPAQLIKMIPIIAITAQSFQLIDAGPSFRRTFLDYGAFHFDKSYYQHLLIYQKALKNRNAGLKQKMDKFVINSFTPMLSAAGDYIHATRTAYFATLKPLLEKHLLALNFPYSTTLLYSPGWNTELPLIDSLTKHLDYDYRVSHTRYGPHRGDLKWRIKDGNAENRLSRGQQKSLILAMYLAQIDIISQYGYAAPLLIFDDIASELDSHRRNLILDYLVNLNCQMFFSATEPDFFDKEICQRATLISLSEGTVV